MRAGFLDNLRPLYYFGFDHGRELTLTYKGGSQQVLVPETTPIVMAVEADRSLLKPGEYAFIAANVGADGKMTATRIEVSKDGVKPPK